ncbi:MAG TPA: arabinan endo-1,5-alpha-L-arabinosidase [Polyangia bacterium]|nr:arabinan endo-1,5-alpha-L-arabinosidase [Polyangia bacterium]
MFHGARSLVLKALPAVVLLGGCGTPSSTPEATGGSPGTGSGGTASGGATATGGATSGAAGGATGGTIGSGGAAGTPAGTGGGRAGAGGRQTGVAGAGGMSSGGASGATGGISGGGGLDCPGASYDAAAPPKVLALSGNLGAHDPAAYVVGKTVYLAATGIATKSSTNLTTWGSWPAAGNPHAGAWAPDISNFGGVFHLYYAVSSFGSNKSCIGQETRSALDTGAWAEQGNVICSNMGTNDNWNAIDPNIVLDDAGVPWLDFGSFWGGIKMVKLKTDGTRADTMLYDLASGPAGGAVEGPFIFKRCGYYYLFVSFGSCCSAPYNYTIRVGRSQTVTGPYVDKDGTSMMKGGGTLLVQGNGSWSAPGHNAVITYDDKTYNVFHALAAPSGENGTATLRIAEIAWDAGGWPVSGGP